MHLAITSELERLIEKRLKSGKYATAEDVVAAALRSLDQNDRLLRAERTAGRPKTPRKAAVRKRRSLKECEAWFGANWDKAIAAAGANSKRLTGRESL